MGQVNVRNGDSQTRALVGSSQAPRRILPRGHEGDGAKRESVRGSVWRKWTLVRAAQGG